MTAECSLSGGICVTCAVNLALLNRQQEIPDVVGNFPVHSKKFPVPACREFGWKPRNFDGSNILSLSLGIRRAEGRSDQYEIDLRKIVRPADFPIMGLRAVMVCESMCRGDGPEPQLLGLERAAFERRNAGQDRA